MAESMQRLFEDQKPCSLDDCVGEAEVHSEPTPSTSQPKRLFHAYPDQNQRPIEKKNRTNFSLDTIVGLLLLALSAISRLYQIGKHDAVTWDETHFGKFGAYYINRTFYHDVHPPLAKMIVGLAELLGGHDGSFRYKGGTQYPEKVNYIFQRSFLSLFGIIIVPIAYLTCLNLRMSRFSSFLAAWFVLCDNALCVISKFILLDPILLFFTSMVLYCMTKFHQLREKAFTKEWYVWLALTGLFLGAVLSSKWVGLFCVALVGIYSAEEVFLFLGDKKLGWGKYLWHWVTRLAAFVILPLAIYSACFALHMSIVDETGSGDSRMPSSYQAHIWRNIVLKQPKYVAFGSSVTLRSHQYGVGMMATINVTDIQTLKNNSQVVMNRFKSKENFFFLAKADKSTEPDTEEMPQKYIETSDKFRIFSGDMTLSVLKDKKSPGMSDSWWINLRTSNNTDENDLWDIVNVRQKESNNNLLHTITTEFVIRHLKTGCVLYAPDTEIDGVHEDYSELVCTKNTDALSSRGLLWNIEQVKDHRLERISRKGVPNSFLKNLWHLNGEMARSNNALDVDLEHYEVIESFPYSWPFMLYPMRMNGWEDHNTKYYEIGNPILWWSTAILCLFWLPVKNLVYFICHQRRCANIMPYQRFKEYIWGAKLLWLGWALHYLPFFLMGRVTYIHHYLPALYFALLLLAHELDWAVFSKIKSGAIQCLATLAIATAIGGVFLYFAPFTYGFYGPAEEMKDRQWIPTWNIYYDRYLSL